MNIMSNRAYISTGNPRKGMFSVLYKNIYVLYSTCETWLVYVALITDNHKAMLCFCMFLAPAQAPALEVCSFVYLFNGTSVHIESDVLL